MHTNEFCASCELVTLAEAAKMKAITCTFRPFFAVLGCFLLMSMVDMVNEAFIYVQEARGRVIKGQKRVKR